MQEYKIDFIHFLVRAGALQFGSFVLKSGRTAPYFLNTGVFYTGEKVVELGRFYAEALLESGLEPDVIFGPAYKGIPLAVSTTGVLYGRFGKNVGYTFNRKEEKDHGADAKSILVGAPLNPETKLVLVDDVITAGTAIRESMELLKKHGNPKILGILIALNRMEKNNNGENALLEIEKTLGVPVVSIVTLDEVIEVLYNTSVDGQVLIDEARMNEIREYRARYGIDRE
jgi:orotate phosphoribosyltransferase